MLTSDILQNECIVYDVLHNSEVTTIKTPSELYFDTPLISKSTTTVIENTEIPPSQRSHDENIETITDIMQHSDNNIIDTNQEREDFHKETDDDMLGFLTGFLNDVPQVQGKQSSDLTVTYIMWHIYIIIFILCYFYT